jgi:hypothetical protein
MQFRLVRRTAVITDEVIAEEQPDHALAGQRGDWTETL